MPGSEVVSAISLTELRYLVAVDDERHFGRAAARCSITQPTLSAGIKKLETTLGVTLFERTRRSVRPTAIGTEVANQARRILEEVDVLARVVAREARPLSGPLRVGFIPTLGPYLLPWLLPALERAFPDLVLRLQEAVTAQIVESLLEHRLDAAFVALPVDVGSLDAIPLFEEPFWLLLPAGHRLAQRSRVREEDLAGERILLLTEGHCLRDQALDLCERNAAEVEAGARDVRATSLETLRQLVGASMGCTLLPALAAKTHEPAATTVLRPFRAPAPSRRIALVHRRTYPRPEDLERLADVVRESLPEGVTALPRSAAGRGDPAPAALRSRS